MLEIASNLCVIEYTTIVEYKCGFLQDQIRVVQTHKHSAPYSSLSEATASTTAAVAGRLLLSTRC